MKIKGNVLLILLSICINICSLTLPIYTLQAYDRIITNQNFATFIILTSGAFILLLLDFVFRLLRDNLTTYYSSSNKHEEFIKIISQFIKIKPERLANISFTEKGEIIDELSKTNDFIYQQLFISIVDVIFLFLFLLVIAILSFKLSLIICLILTAFVLVGAYLNNAIIRKHKKRVKSDEKRLSGIVNLIHSSFLAKIYSNELSLIQKQDVIERKSIINTYQLSIFTSLLYNFTTFTSQMIIVATLVIGVGQIMAGTLSFGTLIAIIILAGRLTNPIREMLTLWFRISNFVTSSKRLKDFYNESTRQYIKANLKSKKEYVFEMHDVHIKDAHYLCNPMINSLNIKIKKGECLAITHVSSYQRNLLKKLFTGNITPSKGELNVLGNPLSKLTSEEYFQLIGYITIEDQYINGTILENITGGRDIPHQVIDELCQVFEVKNDILQLENGFQTELNSNTLQELNKNLRLKILLIRSYLFKPKFVIFNIEEYVNEEIYQIFFKFLKYIYKNSAILIISNDHNLTVLADYVFNAEQCSFYDFDLHEISAIGIGN